MKPSLEDYKKLVSAYQALSSAYEQQGLQLQQHQQQMQQHQQQMQQHQQQMQQQQQQMTVKDSAIHQQTEDIKKLDAELLWTRAALEQAQKSLDETVKQAHTNGTAQESLVEEGWQERYMRLKAEMENVRKRLEQRSKDQAHEQRNRILLDMIPLADHLEMALQHAKGDDPAMGQLAGAIIQPKEPAPDDDEQSATPDEEYPLLGNLQATYDAFMVTLKRYNVERIDAYGKPFDPHVHEALGKMPSEDVPSDHVAEVMQTGYIDGEKLLRPARVIVSE